MSVNTPDPNFYRPGTSANSTNEEESIWQSRVQDELNKKWANKNVSVLLTVEANDKKHPLLFSYKGTGGRVWIEEPAKQK
jgi:hypothetical protein